MSHHRGKTIYNEEGAVLIPAILTFVVLASWVPVALSHDIDSNWMLLTRVFLVILTYCVLPQMWLWTLVPVPEDSTSMPWVHLAVAITLIFVVGFMAVDMLMKSGYRRMISVERY